MSITPRNPSQENLRNAEDSESLISSTPMSPLSPLSPISRNQRCLWPKLMEVCSKPCGLVGVLSGSQEWSSGCILYTHYSELNWEPPKTSTFESEVILSTFIYIYIFAPFVCCIMQFLIKHLLLHQILSIALERDDIHLESIIFIFVQSLFCGSHVSWIEKQCSFASNCGSFGWGEPRGMWGGKKMTSDK